MDVKPFRSTPFSPVVSLPAPIFGSASPALSPRSRRTSSELLERWDGSGSAQAQRLASWHAALADDGCPDLIDPCSGLTPLAIAARENDVPLARLALQYGASVWLSPAQSVAMDPWTGEWMAGAAHERLPARPLETRPPVLVALAGGRTGLARLMLTECSPAQQATHCESLLSHFDEAMTAGHWLEAHRLLRIGEPWMTFSGRDLCRHLARALEAGEDALGSRLIRIGARQQLAPARQVLLLDSALRAGSETCVREVLAHSSAFLRDPRLLSARLETCLAVRSIGTFCALLDFGAELDALSSARAHLALHLMIDSGRTATATRLVDTCVRDSAEALMVARWSAKRGAVPVLRACLPRLDAASLDWRAADLPALSPALARAHEGGWNQPMADDRCLHRWALEREDSVAFRSLTLAGAWPLPEACQLLLENGRDEWVVALQDDRGLDAAERAAPDTPFVLIERLDRYFDAHPAQTRLERLASLLAAGWRRPAAEAVLERWERIEDVSGRVESLAPQGPEASPAPRELAYLALLTAVEIDGAGQEAAGGLLLGPADPDPVHLQSMGQLARLRQLATLGLHERLAPVVAGLQVPVRLVEACRLRLQHRGLSPGESSLPDMLQDALGLPSFIAADVATAISSVGPSPSTGLAELSRSLPELQGRTRSAAASGLGAAMETGSMAQGALIRRALGESAGDQGPRRMAALTRNLTRRLEEGGLARWEKVCVQALLDLLNPLAP